MLCFWEFDGSPSIHLAGFGSAAAADGLAGDGRIFVRTAGTMAAAKNKYSSDLDDPKVEQHVYILILDIDN